MARQPMLTRPPRQRANASANCGKKTIRVAVFLASAANTYWDAAMQGAKDVAAKCPNVKLTAFDGKFTTNTQVNQLRDALVSTRYQAWFVGPTVVYSFMQSVGLVDDHLPNCFRYRGQRA